MECALRRDQNKIEIPGQDPSGIGAGGRIYFFYFFSYVRMHGMLNFFLQYFPVFFYIFFTGEVYGTWFTGTHTISFVFRPTTALSRTSPGLCDTMSQIYSHDQYCT